MGNYNKIYFIGIGGIGMSAIARYYKFTEQTATSLFRPHSPSAPKNRPSGFKPSVKLRYLQTHLQSLERLQRPAKKTAFTFPSAGGLPFRT